MACPAPVAFRLCLLAAILVPCSTVSSQDRDVLLRAELRVDLEQPPSALGFEEVTEPGYVPALTDQAAADAVRAEGLWLFSGIIHGFDYVYTPSDRARAIADLFEIQPRVSMVQASQALRVDAVRLEGRVLDRPDFIARLKVALDALYVQIPLLLSRPNLAVCACGADANLIGAVYHLITIER